MSDKGQKREKLYVKVEQGANEGFTEEETFRASRDPRDKAKGYVRMVELRRGDVVLSQEEAALIRSTLVRLEEIASEHLGQMQPVSVLPLLRGGR